MTEVERDAAAAVAMLSDRKVVHLAPTGYPLTRFSVGCACACCGKAMEPGDDYSIGPGWDGADDVPGLPKLIRCCDLFGLPNPRRP